MDLHDLAKNGKLNTVDPNLLTQENLTLQDEDGYTPLHCAANFGHLNQIPRQLLTQENLTIQNNSDK
jgi:ankyrin repeat protein